MYELSEAVKTSPDESQQTNERILPLTHIPILRGKLPLSVKLEFFAIRNAIYGAPLVITDQQGPIGRDEQVDRPA